MRRKFYEMATALAGLQRGGTETGLHAAVGRKGRITYKASGVPRPAVIQCINSIMQPHEQLPIMSWGMENAPSLSLTITTDPADAVVHRRKVAHAGG